VFLHRNCAVTQKRPDIGASYNRRSTDTRMRSIKSVFSMTLNDLNPEVTAFFEVEHLGPDWSHVRYEIRYSTSNRPIWPISGINVLHKFVSIS